jgi:hypothetical protein
LAHDSGSWEDQEHGAGICTVSGEGLVAEGQAACIGEEESGTGFMTTHYKDN